MSLSRRSIDDGLYPIRSCALSVSIDARVLHLDSFGERGVNVVLRHSLLQKTNRSSQNERKGCQVAGEGSPGSSCRVRRPSRNPTYDQLERLPVAGREDRRNGKGSFAVMESDLKPDRAELNDDCCRMISVTCPRRPPGPEEVTHEIRLCRHLKDCWCGTSVE
jgi:hypothetical protein